MSSRDDQVVPKQKNFRKKKSIVVFNFLLHETFKESYYIVTLSTVCMQLNMLKSYYDVIISYMNYHCC